jgi:Ni,Fe-hydrogenase III small subunit/NAD-dependent dihydropyrimidine dehydrogenase PreA subunit
MLDGLKAFFHHGKRFIPDPTKVSLPESFTGLPEFISTPCLQDCSLCKNVCPTRAITTEPLRLALDSCIFCLECQDACPEHKIRFTNNYKMGTNQYERLQIAEGKENLVCVNPALVRNEIVRLLGRSLKLRLVSAGSCNGCELELNAAGNVNFDMGRYGIEFVASPRHADGLVITGPITENSLASVKLTYEAIPSPNVVILVGACALSGGVFKESPALRREILSELKPDLLVPGCPPHPLTFINAILDLIKTKV